MYKTNCTGVSVYPFFLSFRVDKNTAACSSYVQIKFDMYSHLLTFISNAPFYKHKVVRVVILNVVSLVICDW